MTLLSERAEKRGGWCVPQTPREPEEMSSNTPKFGSGREFLVNNIGI
jgi:hypothetical protein